MERQRKKRPERPVRPEEERRPTQERQAEVRIEHGERRGAPGREPEEPSGESEAV